MMMMMNEDLSVNDYDYVVFFDEMMMMLMLMDVNVYLVVLEGQIFVYAVHDLCY